MDLGSSLLVEFLPGTRRIKRDDPLWELNREYQNRRIQSYLPQSKIVNPLSTEISHFIQKSSLRVKSEGFDRGISSCNPHSNQSCRVERVTLCGNLIIFLLSNGCPHIISIEVTSHTNR